MKNEIYNQLPIPLQNFACTIRGILEKRKRFGHNFNTYYEELLKTQWLSEKEIDDFQISKLKSLIDYCNNNIPYYQRIFKENGIHSSDINSLNDLKKLPILTKEDIRTYYKDLINPNFKSKVEHSHTSGSTGKALKFLMSWDAIRYRWAVWFRHKERFGILPGDAYATFTGQVAVPIGQSIPPFWRENYAMKQTVFTMHHITPQKIPDIVKRLNRGEFKYYSGYPSIIYNLAIIIEDLGLKITSQPKVIFTGAESLLDYQRDKISKVFGCFVTDQYGFSEACGNASRCEYDFFHEDFEYGVLECLNPKFNADGTYFGEVLATGFTNLAMPFIRYQVGDIATWSTKKCSCGRHSKVITSVNGRNEDYVITPEGNKILRFDYLFKDTDNIYESQIIQKKLGEIVIRIVKRDHYTIQNERTLEHMVKAMISPKLKVHFEYVTEIEREDNGKFRAVKSYLNSA